VDSKGPEWQNQIEGWGIYTLVYSTHSIYVWTVRDQSGKIGLKAGVYIHRNIVHIVYMCGQ